MSDFVHGFWSLYISIITIAGFVGLFILLLSQNKVKKAAGEQVKTMGHVWDGNLEEYNNPLPRWWMGLFLMTLVFGAIYLVLYPGLGSYKGVIGWSSSQAYEDEVKAAEQQTAPLFAKYNAMPVDQLAKDPAAQQMGQRLFLTYCAQCHGSDARGAKGFPNLRDNDWLWGGEAKTIEETILHGRPPMDQDGKQEAMLRMPAWGQSLGDEKIKDVANYVVSLSRPTEADASRAARGKDIFAQNCAACHAANGKGTQAMGAPNLTDNTWLYGYKMEDIVLSITNGRGGLMPAQEKLLGKDKVHLLAAYVYGLPKDQ